MQPLQGVKGPLHEMSAPLRNPEQSLFPQPHHIETLMQPGFNQEIGSVGTPVATSNDYTLVQQQVN